MLPNSAFVKKGIARVLFELRKNPARNSLITVGLMTCTSVSENVLCRVSSFRSKRVKAVRQDLGGLDTVVNLIHIDPRDLQDVDSGALLSGGVLDMIAVKHTPVRPVPTHKLEAAAMEGTKMAVNVDPSTMTDEQKQALESAAASNDHVCESSRTAVVLAARVWRGSAPTGLVATTLAATAYW